MKLITNTLVTVLLGLLATAAQAASVTFTFDDIFEDSTSGFDGTALEVTFEVDDEALIGSDGSLDSTVSFSFDEYSGNFTPMYIFRGTVWGGGALPNFSLTDTDNASEATIELFFSQGDTVLDSVEDLLAAAMASELTVSYDLNFETAGGEQALEGTFSSISVSEVPLPAAVWLFASGLAGFVAISRRRQSCA